MLPEGCSDGVALPRLAVAGLSGIFSSLWFGSGSVSRPLAESGTPQHPKKAKKLPFFFLGPTAGEPSSELSGVAVGPVPTPKRLLDVLPLRFRRNILPLDSLDWASVLSLGFALAPLKPVAVGEGWFFWDLDEPRRPRERLGAGPSSDVRKSFSFVLPEAD